MATESFLKDFRVSKRDHKKLLRIIDKPCNTPIERPIGCIDDVKKEDIKKFLGLESD